MKSLILLCITACILSACSPEKKEAENNIQNIDRELYGLNPQKPDVLHVGLIDKNIVGITFLEHYIIPSEIVTYESQPGDSIIYDKDEYGYIHERLLVRNGQKVGFIIGEDEQKLSIFEHTGGDSINENQLDIPETYHITSDDDPAFSNDKNPETVYRKTKVNTWANPDKQLSMLHTVYLTFQKPLQTGAVYKISCQNLNLERETIHFYNHPKDTRSEAVHVSQVGFRSDDPVKRGYLSVWKGTGRKHTYEKPLSFSLINSQGEQVFSADADLALGADAEEKLKESKNYSKTEVWHLDFSAYSKPGTYKLYVEGIGCSYPFKLSGKVYEKAFKITMLGFLHHRSGIELGPPFTDYIRPRCFHPEDGIQIYQSYFSPLDNWMHYGGGQGNVFKGLVENQTDIQVDNAWGGYMDAGDWDRRIQHVWATRQLLELYELFPARFQQLKLQVPEKEVNNNIPDILDEAMWNIDCYFRMQHKDGGIPYGIESAAHPVSGEVSWLESLPVFVFRPDPWSSFIYAGVAAKAARLLKDIEPEKAGSYQESALRALAYGLSEKQKLESQQAWQNLSKGRKQSVEDEKIYAITECYHLTNDKKWHEMIKNSGCFEKDTEQFSTTLLDAAFTYANMDDSLTTEKLRSGAEGVVIQKANLMLAMLRANAFNLTHRIPEHTVLNGYYSAVNNQELCRAHYLTNKKEYLEACVLSCQFTAGANPMNKTYTTGLGIKYAYRPLHLDSERSGQDAPDGITVYGQADHEFYHKELGDQEKSHRSNWATWATYWFAGRVNVPSGWEWPPHEAYYDYSHFPSMNEYTIMQTFGPVSYAYGYLAARE